MQIIRSVSMLIPLKFILRSLRISLCMASLIIVPLAVHAETAEIRKLWSSDAFYTWTGGISVPLRSLSITVNGSQVDSGRLKINNYTGTAHVCIHLEYGVSNLIVIRAGNNILFTADVFYAPTYDSGLVPEEYEFRPFHIEANEKACLDCHRLSIEESDIKPLTPADSICFPCHSSEFSGLEFQHKEAGISWECLRCHQSEAMEIDYATDGPVKFIIKEGASVAPLCYQCHTKSEKEHSEYQYIHGPVAVKGCNMCHDPHGSKTKHLLRKDISTMCIECHGKKEMMKQPNMHAPVVKQGCLACHSPHGSNSPYFLAAGVKEVCLKCHPKTQQQKNNHPVNGHHVSGPKDPTYPERQFSCVSCHNPHSSQFDKLLSEEDVMMICIKCHPTK